jgi:hypothetical protein
VGVSGNRRIEMPETPVFASAQPGLFRPTILTVMKYPGIFQSIQIIPPKATIKRFNFRGESFTQFTNVQAKRRMNSP